MNEPSRDGVLVLARAQHGEAMRVASGLTIAGQKVRLVFMTGPVEQTEENASYAELLELADIVPETTVPLMADELNLLDWTALAEAVVRAEKVISL